MHVIYTFVLFSLHLQGVCTQYSAHLVTVESYKENQFLIQELETQPLDERRNDCILVFYHKHVLL